ncbi:MAG: ATP-dependent chaperone ClpB, partial [Firmicutes bacterium]|nr:ATP-dependent chaperone ClpB [Bacillota bacterium]
RVMKLVKTKFKPEFINRIDEIIIFNALSLNVQMKIAKKMLNDLRIRLEEKNLYIELGEEIEKYVIKNGFNDEYGARPLKRYIQRHIETLVAMKIIDGTMEPHVLYQMVVKDNNLQIQKI